MFQLMEPNILKAGYGLLAVGTVFTAPFVNQGCETEKVYHIVDISSSYNYRLQNMGGAAPHLPVGQITAPDGVPLYIGEEGNNVWHSEYAAADSTAPVTLCLEVQYSGATEVHTAINTWWGQAGASTSVLELYGSEGTVDRVELIGDVDIRDYLSSSFTNTINETTIINAVLAGSGQGNEVRIDKQKIVLSAAFAKEDLTRICLTDTGSSGYQRAYLVAATVLANQ